MRILLALSAVLLAMLFLLYWDHNSDQALNESIWQVAASIGYTQTFIAWLERTAKEIAP